MRFRLNVETLEARENPAGPVVPDPLDPGNLPPPPPPPPPPPGDTNPPPPVIW